MDCRLGRIPLSFWFVTKSLIRLSFEYSNAYLCICENVSDNAMLTQSHYMLMEPILLFFAMSGVLCVLKFRALERSGNAQAHSYSLRWWGWLLSGAIFLTCTLW